MKENQYFIRLGSGKYGVRCASSGMQKLRLQCVLLPAKKWCEIIVAFRNYHEILMIFFKYFNIDVQCVNGMGITTTRNEYEMHTQQLFSILIHSLSLIKLHTHQYSHKYSTGRKMLDYNNAHDLTYLRQLLLHKGSNFILVHQQKWWNKLIMNSFKMTNLL